VKVRLSAQAEAELETIGDRIAQDDPARAESFVVELREACLGLANSRAALRWCLASNATACVTGCTAIT
jgi:plasmid stabilization system protein ParE